MPHHLLRLGLLVGLLAPLAACDSGSDELSPGEYRAELTGGIERSLDGRATFRFETFSPDVERFQAIAMTSGLGLRQISISAPESRWNRPGTYSLGPEEQELLLIYTDISEEGLFFGAESGTVTLTAVEEDRVAGTFTARLTGGFDEERTAEITGEFDAVFIEPAER